MALSVIETKRLAEIGITSKNSKDGVRHFDIKIKFKPIHLTDMLLLPDFRYGFTEFEVSLKMSSPGKISEHTQTGWIKFEKTIGDELSNEKTKTLEGTFGLTKDLSVKTGREAKNTKTVKHEGTYADNEAELEVLESEEQFVQWKYKDLPKFQRKELQSFLNLFFKWEYEKMPVKGFINMKILDADVRGVKKDLNLFQRAAARFLLKREEGVSLASLKDIKKSFAFTQ